MEGTCHRENQPDYFGQRQRCCQAQCIAITFIINSDCRPVAACVKPRANIVFPLIKDAALTSTNHSETG